MPVILFHGDNSVELDEAFRDRRASFAAESTTFFDGSSTSLATLAEATRTVGLFDPDRLIIVTDLHERLKGRKVSPEAEEIRSLLSAVPASTTLLLVARDINGDHALVTIAREAGAQIRAFSVPHKGELARWIIARAQRHQASIVNEAAALLGDLVGNSPMALDSEIEKLAVYAGSDALITREMVDTLVGAVTQETIFTLVDAIADGQGARALHLLHVELEASSGTAMDFALYLIRMLTRQMRILLRVRVAQDAGRGRREIISDAKVPPYYAERYLRQARRFSRVRLARTFETLAALEYVLKSSEADAATGLDLLVTDLCA